jgi:hypothetical protein
MVFDFLAQDSAPLGMTLGLNLGISDVGVW